MVELRWAVRGEHFEHWGSIISKEEKTLEYRYPLSPLEDGLHPVIWSEWMPVETVVVEDDG
jgi:hypothetical protein